LNRIFSLLSEKEYYIELYIKRPLLEKTSSEGSYINSLLDIYFRICVQFNQLFITISYFLRYKYLNYMHDTKL